MTSRHRAKDDAARICACRQEIDDVVFAPAAKRIRTAIAQAWREVILDHGSGEERRSLRRRLRLHLHYEVARRVTLPAVAEAFHEISAARDGRIAFCLAFERVLASAQTADASTSAASASTAET